MAAPEEAIEIERALLHFALRCPNEWVPFRFAELETWFRPKVPSVRRLDLIYALQKLTPHTLQLRRWYGGQFVEYAGINQSPSDYFDGDEYGVRETGATQTYLGGLPPEDPTVAIQDPDERRRQRKKMLKDRGLQRLKAELTNPSLQTNWRRDRETTDLGWEALKEMEEEEESRQLEKQTSPASANDVRFVSETRIVELQGLSIPNLDQAKLVRLCQELNVVYSNDCFLATACLTRALLDHVPPVFGFRTFTEVVSQYGNHTFKKTMTHLDSTARNIADKHLHEIMRRKESLPERQQVSFSAALDVLLSEIIALHRV